MHFPSFTWGYLEAFVWVCSLTLSLVTSLSVHSTWEIIMLIQLEGLFYIRELLEGCKYLRVTWEFMVMFQLEGLFLLWELVECCEYLRITWVDGWVSTWGICSIWELIECCEYLRITFELMVVFQLEGIFSTRVISPWYFHLMDTWEFFEFKLWVTVTRSWNTRYRRHCVALNLIQKNNEF